jgi:hypothetical protein
MSTVPIKDLPFIWFIASGLGVVVGMALMRLLCQ